MEQYEEGVDRHGSNHKSLARLQKEVRKRIYDSPPGEQLEWCIRKGSDGFFGPVRPVEDVVKEQGEDVLKVFLAGL